MSCVANFLKKYHSFRLQEKQHCTPVSVCKPLQENQLLEMQVKDQMYIVLV